MALSKSVIKTLEECSKLAVKAEIDVTDVVLLLISVLEIIIDFYNCSGVYIVDFEQVNASRVKNWLPKWVVI